MHLHLKCRLLAALEVTVQASGPALSFNAQCAFASHVLWVKACTPNTTHLLECSCRKSKVWEPHNCNGIL